MHYVRSVLFVIWLYGFLAIYGTLYIVTFFLPRFVIMRGIAVYAWTIKLGLKWICGITVEFRGRENLPKGAIIYAGKHHCMYDIFVPFLLVSDPCIILKKELVWTPFIGWYAVRARMIPIDRAGTSKTLKKMVKAAEDRAAKGRQLIIFPEGTRTSPFAAPDYKAAGISAFNKALNLPIVPVATNAGLCWPAKGLLRRPGRIVYEVLPPIPGGLDRRELMRRLETALETASNALIQEGLKVQGREAPAPASEGLPVSAP